MKKTILLLLSIYFLSSSCKKDYVSKLEPQIVSNSQSKTDILDRNRTEFTQVLAKAVTDLNIRVFIQKEASEKFDNDYDILFQLVKNKEVHQGITFIEYLSNFAESKEHFLSIIESLPLLTILVPELPNFSNSKWNVDTQIPLVAVVNSDRYKNKKSKIVAYDFKETKLEFVPNKAPSMPIIIVKENERVTVVDSTMNQFQKFSKENFILKNQTFAYYFSNTAFNKKANIEVPQSLIVSGGGLIDSKLKSAYDLSAPSQRDYVYYDILTPTGSGPLDMNYAEFLQGFAVANTSSMNYLYDDPTSDFSDGALEFQMDVLFFNGTSSLSSVSKVFTIPRSSLLTSDESNTVLYWFPVPIQIATWDMQKYGDTWKYVVREIDPGTVTTTTHTSSSTIGTNFSYNIGLDKIVKLGLNFGATSTNQVSNSIQIQVTQGSDFCGEAISSFSSPLIIEKKRVFGVTTYGLQELNTGTVSLLVLPRHL